MIHTSALTWNPETKEITVTVQSHDANHVGEAMVDVITGLTCHLLKHGAQIKALHDLIDAAQGLVAGVEEQFFTDTGALGSGNAAN